MSDATTDFARLLSPQEGDVFDLDWGSVVIDEVTADSIGFVATMRGISTPRNVTRMTWEGAVRRYWTRNDPPTMTCPRCKAELPDFDGFGVLAHTKPAYEDGCGYCSHPSIADGVCGICGKAVSP